MMDFLLVPLMDQTSTFHGFSVRNLWADLGDALSQQCLWHETPGRLVNSGPPDVCCVFFKFKGLRGLTGNN